MKPYAVFVFCAIFSACGCASKDNDMSNSRDITWYSLPYDIKKEKAFGGKSWKNIEVWRSNYNIVWPFSIALDDIKSSFPHIWLFCHKGRCCIWFDSHAFWVKKSCMIYTATKEVVWLRLKSRVIANERGQETDWVDVDEITDVEFRAHAQDQDPEVRYLELKGSQAIIGACGRLRGYNLKELDLKVMDNWGRSTLIDALHQIDMDNRK